MRQLAIGKKKVAVPERWEEVTLGMYIEASTAMKLHHALPRRAIGASIAALCGFNESRLMAMQIEDIEQLTEALGFFFETSPEPTFVGEFEIDGIVYKVPSTINSATFGEFIDMDTEIMTHKENLKAAVPGILAVYCRPDGEQYALPTQDEMEARSLQRSAAMRKLPMHIAEGLAAFFLTSATASQPITTAFGKDRVLLIYKVQQLVNSLGSTVGWQRFCNWPRRMFLQWIRWRLNRSMKL